MCLLISWRSFALLLLAAQAVSGSDEAKSSTPSSTALAPVAGRSEAKGPSLDHWSLQPIRSPNPPTVRNLAWPKNPIDRFILARLEQKGLSPAPEATRQTLIRRLSFDLTGLPPTPDEVERFVQDISARAYEQLVDRLLASRRYGERWGRHWLDVARYTESQGFEYDKLRDNAWHYRDYVIESFNQNKPYDQFMREQVAGDVLEPVTTEKIIAASLLVCGPWDEAGNSQANTTQRAITREDELEDILSVVGQTFLGLTLNCARCHSHKFDPISIDEYYRLKSVFDGVKHGERVIAPPAVAEPWEKDVARRKENMGALKREIDGIEADGWKLAVTRRGHSNSSTNDIPLNERLDCLAPEQRARREAALAEWQRARTEFDALKPLPVSYAGIRQQPAPTHRLKRGDVKSPEDIVAPGVLAAVREMPNDLGLAPDAPEGQRRLAFAQWLSDARHPLPARVMANRIWHLHFGQGLVATPNDFGAAGAKPSHPELLDWLAAQFIADGWNIKALHRLLVTSATYRQSSTFNEQAAAADADNTLLWRFTPHRLEAECLRDAMLAASGQLNLSEGGPSFRPFEALKFPANAYVPADKLGPEYNRRTVYRMNVNSGKEPLMDAFDCPDPAVKTPRRGITTTPLQALGLMNNSFVMRQARHLAEAAQHAARNETRQALVFAYRRALGRSMTDTEFKRAMSAMNERGLEHICWALFNSTEFLYVQ